MAHAEDQELVDRFEQFYRRYYSDEVGALARQYPREQKSLYVDWRDLERFDPDIADDYRSQPEQFQEYAEEALRRYDLPVDVSLGQAHVRVHNLRDPTEIRAIRSEHVNNLVAVQGIVRKATDVRPKITEAAFECQRCGTLTRIPQSSGEFQEPHECQGCERQGPFQINFDQSEFIDAQKLRVQESPEGLRGGETPQAIDVHVEDDITGQVTPGDHVTVTGVLHLDQQSSGNEKSPIFDIYMEGIAVEIEDEEFEEMDITDEDKADIVELSETDDIYEKMVASIAPSIYGHEQAKLAMLLQLFSGVTKHLPDGSRTRGDLHMLLIGDPGTGKCLDGDTKVSLADGRQQPIRDLVESNLDEPTPVDDGVYDTVDFEVPSLRPDGSIDRQRATRVWKREAPDKMYRIRTARGRELEVTPSHPLFVPVGGAIVPRRARDLDVGSVVATAESAEIGATDDAPRVVSDAEKRRTMPDGGHTAVAREGMLDRTDAPTAAEDAQNTPRLVESDVRWDRIESIEAVEPEDDWVYDLEVEGTHNYLSNGVVSHNSALLQYIRNIAPRSVYTSGKGSSAAGLCVTGDTVVHTDDGFIPIRDIATEYHPDPVTEETSAAATHGVYTFDRETGSVERTESSHAWRMPEKPCRKIETAHGKELEASTDTPLLVCTPSGLEWRSIADVDPGDHVAVPAYGDIDRSSPPVREFVEFTEEKIKPTDESVAFLRDRLCEEFGTLRDAAAALDLSEDFVYDTLSNRHIPLQRLQRVLDGVGAELEDVDVERAMLRHGDGVRIPDAFDEDLMYLVGLVFGDGDVMVSRRGDNRGHVRISNGDEQLLETAAEIMEEKFGKSVEIERQEDRVPCIRLHSATVARFFANLGVESPKGDVALDPRLTTAEHADAFLRGLFDADGSVSARDDGGSSVQFSTICGDFVRQVQLMLETYGVRSRRRERDRRGPYELENGHEIEPASVQTHLAIYGRDVDVFAEEIGFESRSKSAALASIVDAVPRRGERLPIGETLVQADGAGEPYHQNVVGGKDPSRARARNILADRDLGDVSDVVEEVVEADVGWDEVVEATDTGHREVFDLTVPETHNFLGNGVVTHNTAAAVRDDFGDGQQWTLEAGALVLADRGIAAVDELDKMRCVTGDTLVSLGDGRVSRIRELAMESADAGTVEPLPNGRTIRDVDLSAWTMTEEGQLVERPVTAIHEYDAPETLTEVTLESGESLTTTDDHPFFVFEDGERVERPAADLEDGDWLYVPRRLPGVATDGGSAAEISGDSFHDSEDAAEGDSRPTLVSEDVALRQVVAVDSVASGSDGEIEQRHDPKVYDLTVEGTHNFVANGMIVHNSEDQSAMHEALEQQSYHPDTELLLADGRRVDVGEFVDERMAERPGDVVDGVDCEILPVEDVAVHSTDLEAGETEKLPVDRVSRHEAPEEFVRLTFSNGRSVTVTPEHPTFVDRGEGVETVPAEQVEEDWFAPAPRKLPNSAAPVSLADEPRVGTEKDVDLPETVTPALGEILGFLVAEGHSYAGSAHEIGFSNQDERLLARMDDLMGRVFGVESTDTTNAAGTVTKRWVSTKLYRWFENNVPAVMGTAREKRIPDAVLGASEEVIRRFLVGAFAGDGGVESEALSFSTASAGLARDYADALAKIGVATRIHHDTTQDSWKTYVMGDATARFVETVVDPADERYAQTVAFAERSDEAARHHDVLPTSAAREIRALRRLLGLRLTGRFTPAVEEGYGVQVETVAREVETLRDRIETVRERLSEATTLDEMRSAVGWSGRRLAERIDETTSAVHYAESGGYDAERRDRMATRARSTVASALDDAEARADALAERCDLRFYRITDVETIPNEGEAACEWVYDVTVEPTNTFVSSGVVLHNSISVSKAGINATLKSRCSLLGAANPTYGRFDQYEPIGEQIDLDPPLISRFDLIFTVTDQPDEERDRELAEHILQTNYAGELNTHRTESRTGNVSEAEVEAVTEDVAPAIEADLLRKYVAYAKRNVYPTMTEEAREAIRDFYVDLRAQGQDEDAPVPVTARKLEALVRLAEASARLRLADEVTAADAERVIDIVRSCLRDIGVDPETGEFDADIIETGTSKTQRDRIQNLKTLIAEIEEEFEDGAPIEEILDRAEENGMERSKAEHEMEQLRQKGEVYEPRQGHLRTT